MNNIQPSIISYDLTTVILTTVLILITGWYAFVTWQILNQQRREEKIKYRPYLGLTSVKLHPQSDTNQKIYAMELANRGATPARDIYAYISFHYTGWDSPEDNMPAQPNLLPNSAYTGGFRMPKHLVDRHESYSDVWARVRVAYRGQSEEWFEFVSELTPNPATFEMGQRTNRPFSI